MSFITEGKFVEKRGAIMDYSRLAWDIPREKTPPPPARTLRYDLSKLTDEELREHMRLRQKALIEHHEEPTTL